MPFLSEEVRYLLNETPRLDLSSKACPPIGQGLSHEIPKWKTLHMNNLNMNTGYWSRADAIIELEAGYSAHWMANCRLQSEIQKRQWLVRTTRKRHARAELSRRATKV